MEDIKEITAEEINEMYEQREIVAQDEGEGLITAEEMEEI